MKMRSAHLACLLLLPLVVEAAAGEPMPLTFLSLGDWGVANKLPGIATQMAASAEKSSTSFALLLGDNFYENGVSSDDPQIDGQWNTTYRDPFAAPVLQKMKFYVVRGNHDWHTNPDAEIDYYKNRRDERWYFPSPYYKVTQRFCVPAPPDDAASSEGKNTTEKASDRADSRRRLPGLGSGRETRHTRLGGVEEGRREGWRAGEQVQKEKENRARGHRHREARGLQGLDAAGVPAAANAPGAPSGVVGAEQRQAPKGTEQVQPKAAKANVTQANNNGPQAKKNDTQAPRPTAHESEAGTQAMQACGAGQVERVVDLVFIDTVPLAPRDTEKEVKYTSTREAEATAQLSWIDSTLNGSSAHFLFVVGHYPVYSTAEHGDTHELVRDLEPLLSRYRVDAYLCGHDHTIQHLQKDGVSYLVNGNGAKDGTLGGKSKGGEAIFSQVRQSFMLHEVGASAWRTSVLSATGELLYSFTQEGGRHAKANHTRHVQVHVRGQPYAQDQSRRLLLGIVLGSVSAVLVLLGIFIHSQMRRRKAAFAHRPLPADSLDVLDSLDVGELEMEEL